jgi:hypothetical protein
MMKRLMIALALAALAQSVAHTVDRATVAKQVAEKCRKDYPDPDYVTQLGCRQMHMEAYDKLEQQDREQDRAEQGRKDREQIWQQVDRDLIWHQVMPDPKYKN